MREEWHEIVGTRYDRHHLIDWWDQNRLAHSSVLVAGSGALGNEVLKLLALIGIGEICVVDFDKVELSNLSRCILFRQGDIGRMKAEVAAERVRAINPDVQVTSIVGDIEFDLGLGQLKRFDFAIGCVDTINARWALNRACRLVGVPWIDGGIDPTSGQVAYFSNEHPACFECTITGEMWTRFNQRYSCTKTLNPLQEKAAPTTAPPASIVSGIQVQQAVAHLLGFPEKAPLRPGQRLLISLQDFKTFLENLPSRADCLGHERIERSVIISGTVKTLSPATIAAELRGKGLSPTSLLLTYDLAVAFECDNCGAQPILAPVKKLGFSDGICPGCGGSRVPVLVNQIGVEKDIAQLSLAKLGVAEMPILRWQLVDGADVYVEVV